MKKIIITLTIISFMNLIGCYYQEQMNPGDYKFDENSKLTIKTRDSVYNYIGDDSHFKNDTVHGIQSLKINTLVNQAKQSGTYKITWNAKSEKGGLPSGVYIYSLRAVNPSTGSG